MSFVHLHVHTEYSLLDGAASIPRLIARTRELGMRAVAITDHGVLFGAVEFYKEAKKQGIKPIIGCEVYTAARSMHDKDADRDKTHGHLILLAKNDVGYRNLMKIVSRGFTEGFYYKPRIDYDLLRGRSEGLIALSACLAGNIQRRLLNDDYEGAKAEALELLDIFGEGNFFLEVQDQGMPEEARILPLIRQLHKETGIPLAATNDVHYVNKEDAEAHDVLLCIQTARTVDDENRMRFPNDEFYLKSPEEMARLFIDMPDAIANTVRIAEECNFDYEFGKIWLPDFQSPEGMENGAYLRKLCFEGLSKRYDTVTDELVARLEYELSTIQKMGYVEYFLIVWDFIDYAKRSGIMVGPGRGSAAGSLVAYCLRITDIDPIRYGLIFERFLNPDRVTMPDIDIDFCFERRQEVINYVIDKYGADKVAQIITFGTMKAKAAVRDVGRALNMSYAEVDAIAKKIPFDLKMTIDRALETSSELKKDYDSDKRIRRLIDTAKALEGMPRHASTHAAGVVISRDSIDEYVPLYLSDKGISTQFTMGTIEELGLLKMDFLGLRNLTVIRDALELIWQEHGVRIDFSGMAFDDHEVFELISAGNTLGVFQLESPGMRQFMRGLKPDCFEDIIAGISLYRPGPMDSIPTYIQNKKNPGKIRYVHKSLEPILSVTYGCLVYQEQVMQIVRDLAGYSYGRSDLVRRVMSKKKMAEMLKEQSYFVHGKADEAGNIEIPGCLRNGIPQKAADEIYGQMEKFAEYAFNKSHAAAYAVLAYETAYLKRYYPVEFMAALMTSVTGDSAQVAKYMRNCADMGIKVLPPCVNASGKKFTVSGGAIRFGLLGVKNVGEGVIDAIVRMRSQKGLPESFQTFIDNIDIAEINKKAIESLIKAGAFDCMGRKRAVLLAVYERLIESAQNSARKNLDGQLSLFQSHTETMQDPGAVERLPDVAEFPSDILLSMEKEMLGLYVSGHPLSDYAERIRRIVSVTTEELLHAEDDPNIRDGMAVILAGIITGKKTMVTKSGKMMAFVQLEDLYGSIEIVVFPNVFESNAQEIREENVVVVNGRLNFKEEEAPKVLAEKILPLALLSGAGGQPADGPAPARNGSATFQDSAAPPVRISIPASMDESAALGAIREILARHPGARPVVIVSENSGKRYKTDKSLWVDATEALRLELDGLLGSDAASG